MKLAEIIKKAARGEELNALEKAELERFDPDALSSRADTAEAKLKEAQEKLDAAEQEKLTEAERYKKRAEAAEAKLKTADEARRTAETERDHAKKEHAALIRRNRINELAARHKCEVADYLDYLAEKNGIDLSDDQKQLYPRYLRKLIMVMCYNKVGCFVRLGRKILACLPGYKPEKKDYFLGRCRALSQFITFQNLGHDNRHTVAQYKEFWDCAIERCAFAKDLMDRAASDVGVSVCRR